MLNSDPAHDSQSQPAARHIGASTVFTGAHPIKPVEHTLALIGGTSSCHMAVAREARFVPGVWGPYYSAMVPGRWLAEGGQSATGALVTSNIFGAARSTNTIADPSDVHGYYQDASIATLQRRGVMFFIFNTALVQQANQILAAGAASLPRIC